MDADYLKSRPSDELADAIGQLHAAHSAVHQTLLEFIVAYEEKQSWQEDDASSMSDWLARYLGLSISVAREWVRVARALQNLPALGGAYREGRLPWEQVRALSRVATPETDAELVDRAIGLNAIQVNLMARGLRKISTSEVEEAIFKRSLRMYFNEENRSWTISGRLPDADGAVVEKALQYLADKAMTDTSGVPSEPYDSRCADALVELASTNLSSDAEAHRATVVVHVDLQTLRDGDGVAEIDDGPAIAAETARRLACDSILEAVIDGPDGQPVGIGRKSRQIPPWLFRQLRRRDRGCVFPGCYRTRWLHAHHIEFWSEGGTTDRDNLVIICGHHHRMIHEGGWRIRGQPGVDLEFVSSLGHLVGAGPPALRPEVRARLPAA